MARPVRIEVRGGWYHVTARGNERRAVFRDDRDRRHFLELLQEWVDPFGIAMATGGQMWPCIWLGSGAGMRLRELAETSGGLDYGSVQVAVRRLAKRMERDRELAAIVKKLKEQLFDDET